MCHVRRFNSNRAFETAEFSMLGMCYVMCIADLFHKFCGGQNLLDVGVLFGVFDVWPCI